MKALAESRDVTDVQQDGYFLARLDNNFVTAPPTALQGAPALGRGR
jgi:hypothetical protein